MIAITDVHIKKKKKNKALLSTCTNSLSKQQNCQSSSVTITTSLRASFPSSPNGPSTLSVSQIFISPLRMGPFLFGFFKSIILSRILNRWLRTACLWRLNDPFHQLQHLTHLGSHLWVSHQASVCNSSKLLSRLDLVLPLESGVQNHWELLDV